MFRVFCVLAVSVISTSDAFARLLIPVEADARPAKGVVVAVHDEAGVLAEARVIVETLDGRLLFDGRTDRAGELTADVPEGTLLAGVNVTASATGHGVVTFLSNVAHHVSLEVPRDPADAFSVLAGKLTGFKDSDDDSKAQAGLVAEAIRLDDLAQLDTSSIISPLDDQIDLLGKRNIPSNLVLPDQTFPVYFIPIHLEKPTYRLPVLAGSSRRYFGVTGGINVQDAVNALQKKNGWEIINALTFQKVGLTAPVNVPVSGQTINLDLVSDVEIKESLTLHPGKNTSPGESHRLAVALWQAEPGLFVPTDVKLQQGDADVTLTALSTAEAKVMDILVDKDGRYRGAWLSRKSDTVPDAGLSAGVVLDKGLDGPWLVSGGETADLTVVHLEDHEKNSVGTGVYLDRWVLVGPRRAAMLIPAAARIAFGERLGKISHLSVDLLQTGHASYPFVSGENATRELVVLEKVRKAVK